MDTVAPPSAADNARYFRVAPNDLRVVTNVDHNVHTILDPKNHDRALLAVTQLCGVKAPLTFDRRNAFDKARDGLEELAEMSS